MRNKKTDKVVALILAGGKSRRMGGEDKSQKQIQKKNLLDISFDRLLEQVETIIVNTNNKEVINKEKNKIYVPDCMLGNLGPLAGVLTGLKWIKKNTPKINWLLTVPVDSPFFPKDLIYKFIKNLEDEVIISAMSGSRIHPVFSMWNTSITDSLEHCIKKKILKIDEFKKNFKSKVVNFPIIDYDPFYNINNLEDLLLAREIYSKFFNTRKDLLK